MEKTILLTGATDGIGLETAKMLARENHNLILHGRNLDKLDRVVSDLQGKAKIDKCVADLSDLKEVSALADTLANRYNAIDVVINNAGVFRTPAPRTDSGLDIRFVVNTLAPYVLTCRLETRLGTSSRIVNVASAAQAPVEIDALEGRTALTDNAAYAQSKLALMMWTYSLAQENDGNGPIMVSVNPASLLGSKMVKEAYGMDGGDLGIGADILFRAALSDEFADASGRYYDNDRKAFGDPHPDVFDDAKLSAVMASMNELAKEHLPVSE
ncbi:MAG: SDR family NAD(P)-dependent oxidoreductase [Pseudomonadota bacterium]